jgi:hypothetical protein
MSARMSSESPQDADEFAASVSAGIVLLDTSEPFQKAISALSLQEQLRPLFCPVELTSNPTRHPLSSSHNPFVFHPPF